MRHRTTARVLPLVALLVAPALLAGCTAPLAPGPPCDATTIIHDGLRFLRTTAHPDGGVPTHPAAEPDPRTTAWALLAAGLARRTGTEGGFAADPHITYLKTHLDTMLRQGSPIDSAANNLSLARAALQAWGRPADGIPLDDPEHPDARSLQAAWEARYDATNGSYGARLNEHLFGAFAAWLFEPPGARLAAMAEHTTSTLARAEAAETADPTTRDAWWAAYARASLGPRPADAAFAARLDQTLADHQDDTGGVRGFATAKDPDASTTAAAILAWIRSEDTGRIDDATAWLCSVRRDDGAIPFSAKQPILLAKTTSEVLIGLALHERPVPWSDGEA